MVAAKEPVPLPVTSPVSVIVWSPVLEPDTLADAPTVSVLEVSPTAKVRVLPAVRFSLLAKVKSKAPVPVERMLRDVRESTVPALMSAVVATRLAIVPKLVSEEAVTVELSVVPVRTPAAAAPLESPYAAYWSAGVAALSQY